MFVLLFTVIMTGERGQGKEDARTKFRPYWHPDCPSPKDQFPMINKGEKEP